jgi:hypothetical protein
MSVSLERLVRNQVLFREVNDRILEVNDKFGIGKNADFICECSQEDCTDTVELDVDEYETIRSNPTWFVIAKGHESLEVEKVIQTNGRFAVVEKTHAVELTIETDPRAPKP